MKDEDFFNDGIHDGYRRITKEKLNRQEERDEKNRREEALSKAIKYTSVKEKYKDEDDDTPVPTEDEVVETAEIFYNFITDVENGENEQDG